MGYTVNGQGDRDRRPGLRARGRLQRRDRPGDRRGRGPDPNDAHWNVVNYLRDEYRKHRHTPNFRNMLEGPAKVLPGCDSKTLYDLFPSGPPSRGQGRRPAQPLGKGGY